MYFVTVYGCRFTVFPINYETIGFAHRCSHFSLILTCLRACLCGARRQATNRHALIVIKTGLRLRENCLTGRDNELNPQIEAFWILLLSLWFFINREPITVNREWVSIF